MYVLRRAYSVLAHPSLCLNRGMTTASDITVLPSVNVMREWREKQVGRTIGFVPTMGAFHGMFSELFKKHCEKLC